MNITPEDIVNYRKSKGLSQEDLATILGVSKNTVYNYERGDKIPESKIQILYKTIHEGITKEVKEDDFTTLIIDKLFSSDNFKQRLIEYLKESMPIINEETVQYYNSLMEFVKSEERKNKKV